MDFILNFSTVSFLIKTNKRISGVAMPSPLVFYPLQPHLPLGLSPFVDVYSGGQNSDVGKGICLKTQQGSSSSALTHSLSGTQYSVALIRYCAGLTILTTEKIPSETVRYLSSSLDRK